MTGSLRSTTGESMVAGKTISQIVQHRFLEGDLDKKFESSPLLEVSVKVRELPPVRIDPTIVIFKCRANNKAPTAQVELTANTTTPVAIVDIKKPDWIDLYIKPDVSSLPARLYLTMRETPNKMKFDNQEGVVLKLGEELPKVRIPILVVPATVSQGQGRPDKE